MCGRDLWKVLLAVYGCAACKDYRGFDRQQETWWVRNDFCTLIQRSQQRLPELRVNEFQDTCRAMQVSVGLMCGQVLVAHIRRLNVASSFLRCSFLP